MEQATEKRKSKKPAVIGFYGYSDSGKTSLIERVIKQLKEEGYKVAAVKVSRHAVSLDQPGKDSWRYAQAGAGVVMLSSQNETDFMVNGAMEEKEILRVVSDLSKPDVILIEGSQDATVRKIRLGDIEMRENTIWMYDGVYEHLMKLIHEEIQKE